MTSTETTLTYEQATDTALAEVYGQLLRLRGRRSQLREQLMYAAGCRKRHTTRSKFVWTNERDHTIVEYPEAANRVQAMLDENTDANDYTFNPLHRSSTVRQARNVVEGLVTTEQEIAAKTLEFKALDDRYTGWSRFFLVTSSRGHIHSSMSCSTCRHTTTYGWLPELSGQTEAETVDQHGPALCSVCFPSAPVEWVGGWITAAQAERRSA